MSPFTYFLAVFHTISLLTPLLHSTSTNPLPTSLPLSTSMIASNLSSTPVLPNILPSSVNTPQLSNTIVPSLPTSVQTLSTTLLPSPTNNEPPVVTLSRNFFTFIEGSAPLLIGDSITLSDPDSSNFFRMLFIITDVPVNNRGHNILIFENDPGILISTQVVDANSYSFLYFLGNNNSISDFQTVVSSVRYNNTFEGDFGTIEGNRTIEIFAADSQDAVSQSVRITIAIEARNISSTNTPVLSNIVPASTSTSMLPNTLLPSTNTPVLPNILTSIPQLSNNIIPSLPTSVPTLSNIVPSSTNTPILASIVTSILSSTLLSSTSTPMLPNILPSSVNTPQLSNTLVPSLPTSVQTLSSTLLPSPTNNEPPVVTLSRNFFTFIEGSAPLLIGDSITLSDPDSSNLTRIMFIITDVPDNNRLHNVLIFENDLGFIINTQRVVIATSYSFTYFLENNVSISDFQTVVSSVRYNNTFEGDFATIEGNRTIEILATDSLGAVSQSVQLTIAIEARNISSTNTPILSNIVPASTSAPILANNLLSSTNTPVLSNIVPASTSAPMLANNLLSSTNIPVLSNIVPASTSTPMLPNNLLSSTNTPVLSNIVPASTSAPMLPNNLLSSTNTPVLSNIVPASTSTPMLANNLLSSTNTPVLSNIGPASTSAPMLPNNLLSSTDIPVLPSIVLPSTNIPVLSNTLSSIPQLSNNVIPSLPTSVPTLSNIVLPSTNIPILASIVTSILPNILPSSVNTPQLSNILVPSIPTSVPILSTTLLRSPTNNEPPVVTLSRNFFTFIEGSAPLLIGDSITLSDPDSSNLTRIMFIITDVPNNNRLHNILIFENDLGFIINTQRVATATSYIFTYFLENNVSISDFQTVVSSVRYNNTFEGDFASIEGNRTIEILATDSQGAVSQSVQLTIAIEARNISSTNAPMVPTTLPSCGNGMLEFGEECDHTSAGCNPNTCLIYPLFNCEVNDAMIGITNCSSVVLDTNTSNPFSVDSEYSTNLDIFRVNMEIVDVGVIYLFDLVQYRLSFSRLDNPEINSNTNPITVNIERLTEIFNLTSLTIEPTITLTENATMFVNTYNISQALAQKGNLDYRGCILGFINATQVDISDRPVGGRVRVRIEILAMNTTSDDPVDSNPQTESGLVTLGSASITITSLGTDDSRPGITLGIYNAVFYEGNTSIPIVGSDSTVSDTNDGIYPIQGLTVSLSFFGFSDPSFESISVSSLPNNFTTNYDPILFRLTITGPGLSSEYTEILRSIIYRNTIPEPTTGRRRVTIRARDTVAYGTSVNQFIFVENVNDLPILTFTRLQLTYIENQPALVLDDALTLTDMDPDPIVQSAYVSLASIDNDERISFGSVQNIFAVNNTFLVVNTSLSVDSTRDIFRTVTYQHISDNPTSGMRVITFSLTDNNNGSISRTFSVMVQPVNDPPVVTLSRNFFTFIEDSLPLLIGDSITLTDPDSSNFSRIVFIITDVPVNNRLQNILIFENNLGIIISTDTVVNNFTYILERNTSISDFQRVISSVRYDNTLEGDFASIEGNRTIEILATDSLGAVSQSVRLNIAIEARNDPPILNLGSGFGQNWTFSFTEFDSSSPTNPTNEEHIVLIPIVDISDEENNQISKLTIQLAVSNGQLDPNEFIFVRSPLFTLFDNTTLIRWHTTGIYMEFNGNASALNYTNILRGIYYTNDENEPSLYNFGDRYLRFEVSDVFGATSVSYTVIDTIPINDNRPVLLLRLHPADAQLLATILARDTREISTFDTLNATAFIEKEFRYELDTLLSGDVVYVVFGSEVETRNLAHQSQINSILHFNWDVLNELPKFSYWIDAKTLAILFPRIDEEFKTKLTPLKHSNLSIIFKECTVSEKKCINLCANTEQLTCARGEIGVKIISTNQETMGDDDGTIIAFSLWYFAYFFASILIFTVIFKLILYFCGHSSDKKRELSRDEASKNGFKKVAARKTDEEQINSLKNRKYRSQKQKINPRSTPNIFKYVIGEN